MDPAPLWSLQPFVRYVRRLNIQVGEYPRLLVPCDCRLFYVTETGGWMNFPGQSLALRQGMLLLWRCGYPYGMESRPGSLCRFLAVNFDLTLSHAEESFPIPPVEQEQFCSEQLLCSPLCPELPLDQPLILDNALFVQPLLEQLLEDYEGARPYGAQPADRPDAGNFNPDRPSSVLEAGGSAGGPGAGFYSASLRRAPYQSAAGRAVRLSSQRFKSAGGGADWMLPSSAAAQLSVKGGHPAY